MVVGGIQNVIVIAGNKDNTDAVYSVIAAVGGR
jgi:hypothetical protein